MKEENKKKKNSSGTGFYIALCCCVAAIGIVGFVNSREKVAVTEEISDTENATLNMPVVTLPPKENDEAVINVEAPKTAEIKTEEIKPESTEKIITEDIDVIEAGENPEFYDGEIVETISVKEIPAFIMPVDGNICLEFTGNALYYDTLLGDYRTHDGIDIKASADTDVVAAADGVISEVYTDTLGKTVVIDHNNGFKTKYANLDDIENLSVGMKLKKGDFIAHVGDYALGEMTTEPHIHFELICNNEFLNPAEYIK